MARPKATELTQRELEVMRVFWEVGPGTAEQARQRLADAGVKLAYVTVANVVRALTEKQYLKQTNDVRPFEYEAIRSFDEVSKRLVGDLVERLFDGSREQLLVHVLGRRRLTQQERQVLQEVLEQQKD